MKISIELDLAGMSAYDVSCLSGPIARAMEKLVEGQVIVKIRYCTAIVGRACVLPQVEIVADQDVSR